MEKRVNILSMNNVFSLLKSPEDINFEIAGRMRVKRKEKGLTQQELSKKADVSLGSLKRFERTGEISLSSLIKLSFALGCESDFDSLFAKRGYTSIEEVINEQL